MGQVACPGLDPELIRATHHFEASGRGSGALLFQRLGAVVFLSHRQTNNLLLKGPVLGHLERLKPRDVSPISQVAQEKGRFWSPGVLHGLEKQRGQVEARDYRYLGTWSWRGGVAPPACAAFSS